MHAVQSPGGLAAEELQLLVLRAGIAASSLQPEALAPTALGAAALRLCAPLDAVRRALDGEILGDVGAVARWELARQVRELRALASAWSAANDAGMSPDLAAALVRLGAVRQSALGALLGLDRALAERGLAPALEGIATLELRRALAVRAAFVSFREEIRALGPPERGAARGHLQRVARALQRLRDARGLARLRVADRIHVESLLARIAAAADGSSEAAGIWHDVAAFAEVVLDVNRRAELAAHDTLLAGRLARELAARPMVLGQLAFRRKLERLRGRDDALDALLADPAAAPAAVRERLEALAGA